MKTFRPGLILVCLLLVYFIFLLWQDISHHQGLVLEKKEIEKSLTTERKRRKELEARAQLTESPDYIEGLAREKLGLIKKGEVTYQVISHN